MLNAWPVTVDRLATDVVRLTNATPEDLLRLRRLSMAATQLIDERTGRTYLPTRHVLPDGSLPEIFYMAAEETVRLWWNQSRNGLGGRGAGPDPQTPMGAELPSRVVGWLADYPGVPGFGQCPTQPAPAVLP